ncbi:MAG: heparan-alpha-glucosaminide N-acetyltransferase domain-containing protein [Pontixanthobacter sp.]
MTRKTIARIAPIDMVRGFAILFALMSHALAQFAAQSIVLADAKIWIKLLTRSATPMFFIVFGAMLHLVYLRKAKSEFDETREKLIARGLLCYVLFLGITFAAFVSGKHDALFMAKSIVLLEADRFGTILAIYAVLFGIVAVTLRLALRFGVWFFAGIATAAWAANAALRMASVPPVPGIQQLIGHGEGLGPAILLTFTFVTFGVAIGEAWDRTRSWALPVSITIAALSALIVAAIPDPDMTFLRSLVYEFRWQNHYAYYGYGIAMTAVFLVIGVLTDRREPSIRPERGWLSRFGRETLFAFAAGNIVLNLLPEYRGVGWEGYSLAVVFVLGMWFVTLHKASFTGFANRISFGGVSGIASGYRGLSAMVGKLVLHFIR